MTIFQNSVLKKYLKTQDEKTIDEAYCQFRLYFHNTEIQQNIRNSKEEQFQEGFLRELFVKILGYTLNPQPDFNLTTELKNEKGAKKTDGAILKKGKALAVIELKGTNTKDLDKVNNQAFNYKNNHSDCIYVITSNFEKLRFFIHNAVAYLEFNLFTLTEEEFKILWLCLNAENLLAGVPAQIKQDSIIVEENVTKQLYKDYSTFKHQLWQNICKNQPDLDKLLLFKKTQKLLDRFLFVFFAEDSGLLPPNSISAMVKRCEQLIKLDAQKPLYDIFKQFFNYINTGRKGETAQDDIFAYNGGLFLPDKLLDGLIIDDELLKPHVLTMTGYNFESDIDVNILGHIFENSLSEIENVTAQLEGKTVDKSKTKRKKDGVFYTPKYITKYIVENTVGKLCEEKKTELSIVDKEYAKGRKNRRKKIVQTLYDNLQEYRNWLLEITICDPACGSGAFLNQALEFLIAEHAYIDELEAVLLESSIVFQDVSDHVLEKNLFGVDINEESIDIAKLSLWLRTAQRDRKLTSLNNNIKCGNSLIDDPEVAGEKAFNWEKEFPNVFERGGFDVVVGNPPYISRNITNNLKSYLKKTFQTTQYQLELYIAFIEKASQLVCPASYFSFIVPNSWLKNYMMSDCRNYILSNLNIIEIVPSLEKVFTDASVDTMIFLFSNQEKNDKIEIKQIINKEFIRKHFVSQNRFLTNDRYTFDVEVSDEIQPIIKKLSKDIVQVGSVLDVIRGINPYDKYTGQSADVIKTRAYHSNYKKNETFVPELKGLHLSRYNYQWDKKHFISYGDWLAAPRNPKYFSGERIIFREILGKTLVSTLITENFKIDRSLYIAKYDRIHNDQFDIKYVLGILNSKLMAFYFRYTNNEFDNLFPKIRVAEFKKLPIKSKNKQNQKKLSAKVKEILNSSTKQKSLTYSFTRLVLSKFTISKPTKKLTNWHKLEFAEFLKELEKARKKSAKENKQEYKKLSLSEEAEWMQYFNEQKQKAQELKTQINQTDKEIDKMVYKLYELTPEEIEIVENSAK
ncbi:Eco57I restriction-modification methylase domain-containing protein [Candidatus Venteria ishoeyi]|uniref:site-specific DNA-methyltransferase (adenine-specific) n=1 Tax=Candidatus Venteria ishoeyi TaxID=1899563 RepID=A0A1H6FI59_9GAMM|nr:TaqI-like C-terminal specificity domain-containing protein [Candidatus Venteria ishoeyi]SEH09111.1 Type IIS restriction enzyme Eco57I [Candidatus Venteria ishoeyi]